MPVEGATLLAADVDAQCRDGQEYWYERTNVRKIPHSACEEGLRLDRGAQHVCPASRRHGFLWWMTVLIAPFILAGLIAVWWARRRGSARHGRIRLPEPGDFEGDDMKSNVMATVASVPWFVVGIVSSLGAWVAAKLPVGRSGSGYRSVSIDDDAAELLLDDDDDHP